MRLRSAAVVAGLTLGFISQTASAALIINVQEVAGDVTAVGRGALNITGLAFNGATSFDDYINPSFGIFDAASSAENDAVSLHGVVGPKSFGTGGRENPTSFTGTEFNLYEDGENILVSPTFKSGSDVDFDLLFGGQSLASLGLHKGSFVYSLPNDTITINIGLPSVPLPPTAPMLGAAVLMLGVAGYGMKRKKATASV